MVFPRCKCLGHEQGVTAKSKERAEDPGEPPVHKHLHPLEDDILEKPLDMNAVRRAEDAEDVLPRHGILILEDLRFSFLLLLRLLTRSLFACLT